MDCFYRFCLNYNLLINTRQANRPASYLFYLQELLLPLHHHCRVNVCSLADLPPERTYGDTRHE